MIFCEMKLNYEYLLRETIFHRMSSVGRTDRIVLKSVYKLMVKYVNE